MDNDLLMNPNQQVPMEQEEPTADQYNSYEYRLFNSDVPPPPPPMPPQPIDIDNNTDPEELEQILSYNEQSEKLGSAHFKALKKSVDTVKLYNKAHKLRTMAYLQDSDEVYDTYTRRIAATVKNAVGDLEFDNSAFQNLRRSQRIANRNMMNAQVAKEQETVSNVRVNRRRQQSSNDHRKLEQLLATASTSQSKVKKKRKKKPRDASIDRKMANFYPHDIVDNWLFCYYCFLIHY